MLIKNHYERAVVDFLRVQSVPYLRVNEAKRSVFGGTKFKSFDLVGASEKLVSLQGIIQKSCVGCIMMLVTDKIITWR